MRDVYPTDHASPGKPHRCAYFSKAPKGSQTSRRFPQKRRRQTPIRRSEMKGQSIQGYLVIEKIKEGSVGPVWRGTDSRQPVFAIKQMSAANAAAPARGKRFEKGATL